MIDFTNLNRQELSAHGIRFASAGEAEAFARILSEEFEIRLGAAISEVLDEDCFDSFLDDGEAGEMEAWLEKHPAEYQSALRKVRRQMHRELMQFRTVIPGILLPQPQGSSHPENNDSAKDVLPISA